MLSVRKSCHFHAAHILTGHAGDCRHLHGHTYRVTVEVTQPAGDNKDMVIDFHDLKALLREVVADPFDHAFIYDSTCREECEVADFLRLRQLKVAPLPYRSTAENMARYVFGLLRARVNVTAVTVHESEDSSATFNG